MTLNEFVCLLKNFLDEKREKEGGGAKDPIRDRKTWGEWWAMTVRKSRYNLLLLVLRNSSSRSRNRSV